MEKKEKLDDKRKCFEIPGVRYLFAINGFLGMAVIFALRVNINVAIVAMVNNTAVYGGDDNETTSNECLVEPVVGNSSSQADTPLDGEFIWNPKMQGVILGAFYYGYVISQIPGGRMAELFSSKWVFGLGNLVTALLTLLTPVAARYHVGLLITVRALEGLAQGVTVPAINAMMGRWIPDSEKGVLSTLIIIGVNFGTVVSMPLAGYLCHAEMFGWPAVFYVIGVFGCVWFVIWCLLVSDTPSTHPFISKQELEYIASNQRIDHNKNLPPIPWLKIAKSIPFWALLIARVCQDWSFYILTNDLPQYFHTILHFDIQKNSFLSSFPHLLQSFVGMFVAFVADVIVRKRLASTNFVRKFCNSVSGFGSALGLVAVCFSGCNVTMNVVFFMYLISVTGFVFSGHALTLLDIAPEYAGTLMGICNTISNLNGFLSPLFVGIITNEQQTLYQWRIVFGSTAAIVTFATIVFAAFGSTEKQEWASSPSLINSYETFKHHKSSPDKDYSSINKSENQH